MAMVQAIPDGFGGVTPFYMASDPDGLVAFMQEGLGAEMVSALRADDGKIWHAQMRLNGAMLMVGGTMGEPAMPMMMYLYSRDFEDAYKQAVAAGATSIQEPKDQFYGDKNAGVKDEFGNIWWFARHTEDVDMPEMQRRASEFEKKVKAAHH